MKWRMERRQVFLSRLAGHGMVPEAGQTNPDGGAFDPPRSRRTVRADGLTLQVQVAGEGPPVILLHGFPENSHSWRHQIAPLARAGFSVWVPDLRGYPPSDLPADMRGCHLRHLIADVAAMVEASGYPKAHVVGHDWGGIIAWAFAGRHPQWLDRLVILNAPHMQIYRDKAWRTTQALRSLYVLLFQLPWLPERLLAAGDYRLVRAMFRYLPAQPAFDADDIQRYVDCLSRPGALTAALDYYRANLRHDGIRLAAQVRTDAPVLVIWGERDPALGVQLLDGIERFAPRARVHRIPHASHWVQNEAPEEVNRLLLDFLRRDGQPQNGAGA